MNKQPLPPASHSSATAAVGAHLHGEAGAVPGGAEAELWRVLNTVMDPEIPVLSVVELGIIRQVRYNPDAGVEIGVSPTYTGCPATEVIRNSIAHALHAAGHERVRVFDVLSPPWSSDWISAAGREKLRDYGIAPPPVAVASPKALFGRPPVACPRCSSTHTERISEFGSTPCKAHHRCLDCAEPFDAFKCI